MAGMEDTIRSLREALRVSPQNSPLRRLLAETLLQYGRPAEAEAEYRQAVAREPDNEELKLGLAEAYFRQDKHSHALVIVEELLQRPQTQPRVYALHARLLLKEGNVDRALRQYRRACAEDPALKDTALEQRLGLDADETAEVVEGRVRAMPGAPPADNLPAPERPNVTFAEVGGMDAVKDEIRMKIIHPLTHPDVYAAYGKQVGGGILLYGPPGCGKTHLARATAGEVKAAFISVGINEILDMWIGQSERNLHDVFDSARSHRPCVLFFDEVDALGASRTDMRQSAGRQLINQFLAELDGIKSSNEGVLILAATNAPWHLDAAFRRPGRFDRIVFVPPPDEPARAAILRILLAGKPVAEMDYTQVAGKTREFSGADLKAVVDVAVENKLRAALKAGVPEPLRTQDLLTAARGLRPTTREWFATARNYAVYANQGGIYDDILKYLKL